MGEVYLPGSLREVFDLLSGEPEALLYAGGTDLFVRLSLEEGSDKPLVCLERVEELKGIGDHGDEIRIGGCTTHSELIRSRLVKEHFPLLMHAARRIGAPAVRNMGTIGGNICTASPAGDTLPPLYIFDALVELCSAGRARRVPISEFLTGPGQTALERGEVLSAVCLKKDHGCTFFHFEKVGQRKAMAISVASFAFAAGINGDGMIRKARCAFGSVAPTVFTSNDIDRCFVDKPMDEDTLRQAALLVRSEVSPISDVRASEGYRRSVAGNLVMRLEDLVRDTG